MWNNYYLKFPSENDFKVVTEGLNLEEYVFDILGDLSSYEIKDESGVVIREARFIEGFHVNVRSKLDILLEELSQYEIVKPESPKRIWFGE